MTFSPIHQSHLLFILVFCLQTFGAHAQGCSDAGFCTLNVLKISDRDTAGHSGKNQLKLGFLNGKADHHIFIYSAYLEYTRYINKKTNINAKLVYMSQNGAEAHSSALSDIYLNINRSIIRHFQLTAGIKLPLNNANGKVNNLSLPMDYQTSLGTIDLIAGAGYDIKNLKLTIAIQQPLSQNSNSFLPGYYPDNSGFQAFQPTNGFKRNGDLLFRASYTLKMGRKFRLTPGLLPIYHLGEDMYTDTGGHTIQIKGSDGLTLNGNVFLEYSITNKSAIELSIGTPFIVRETRPDGLTRSYVINAEYRVKF